MRTTTRTAAALLTTAIVIGGTAATANAQATTIKDKASDVVTYTETSENGNVLGYSDSVATGTDVRSMKVKHSKKSVTIDLKFAKLSADTAITVAFRLDGKKQPGRILVSMSKRSADVYNAKDKKVCTAKLTTRTGTKGSVKAVVKRSCLGNPKKIKVAAAASTVESVDTATYVVHQDVVSKSSVRTPTYTKWLKAS